MCPCLLLEARRAATRVQASDQRGGLRGLPTSLALLSVGVCTEQRGPVQPDSLPRANSSVSKLLSQITISCHCLKVLIVVNTQQRAPSKPFLSVQFSGIN